MFAVSFLKSCKWENAREAIIFLNLSDAFRLYIYFWWRCVLNHLKNWKKNEKKAARKKAAFCYASANKKVTFYAGGEKFYLFFRLAGLYNKFLEEISFCYFTNINAQFVIVQRKEKLSFNKQKILFISQRKCFLSSRLSVFFILFFRPSPTF